MNRIATTALAAAMMMMGTAQAQPPGPRPAAPRPQAPSPAVPAIPTRVSAGTLTGLCGQDRSACLTYVLGAVDAYASALVAAGRPQAFCVPRGVTNDQIAQSAVAYLRAHPQDGGLNASVVILAGMRTTYPCGY
ncbi:MAG: Rap1a immunity protein [Sphingomonadales bacterium]|jgi:hypothetical protein|nr:Rap1a immunity protein [Sphingomonadales bacterium]